MRQSLDCRPCFGLSMDTAWPYNFRGPPSTLMGPKMDPCTKKDPQGPFKVHINDILNRPLDNGKT